MTTPTPTPIYFGPYQVPMVNPDTGIVSREWYLFFQAMFKRIGGASTGGGSANYLRADGTFAPPPGTAVIPTAANPSAPVGLTVVPGSAATFMRSDAAPALDVTIAARWTGNHIFGPAAGIPVIFNAPVTGQAFKATSPAAVDPCFFGLLQGTTVVGEFGADGSQNLLASSVNGDLVIRSFGTSIHLTIDGVSSTVKVDGTTGAVTLRSALGINNNAPPAQVTGWGVPAGPAVVAAFPAVPTLAQCGQAIGKIIADLKALGLYGA